jgi:hypothetical protein
MESPKTVFWMLSSVMIYIGVLAGDSVACDREFTKVIRLYGMWSNCCPGHHGIGLFCIILKWNV